MSKVIFEAGGKRFAKTFDTATRQSALAHFDHWTAPISDLKGGIARPRIDAKVIDVEFYENPPGADGFTSVRYMAQCEEMAQRRRDEAAARKLAAEEASWLAEKEKEVVKGDAIVAGGRKGRG
jgi:hypothetical protein